MPWVDHYGFYVGSRYQGETPMGKAHKRIFWFIGLLFVLAPLTVFAQNQNKVVVIPLFGDDTPSVPAPVPKTGQTTSYVAGDDGALKKGVAWPSPRFTINIRKISGSSVNDGTVTDNLTDLVWLKNANCFGTKYFEPAVASVNTLKSGSCGLLDGSKEGDWRLPNIRELHSLISFRRLSAT
jgi:hypothetical protein